MFGHWVLAAAVVVLGGHAHAQELVFATAAEARAALSSKDAFVERLSDFDRAARMKTRREVGEAEFLEFAGSAALDWQEPETRAILAAYRSIKPNLEALHLPLPAEVVLIKTTGIEEGDAAYTRQNAVVLPSRLVSSSPRALQRLLAHELFHIGSRNSPEFAKQLYAAIGFSQCGEAVLPPDFALRKITNPDAPRNDYCIRVTLAGNEVLATPVLFSESPIYDEGRGGEFFDYLQLALLLRPDASTPGVRFVDLEQASGFFEQVGRNTEYVIHPEEILADNFALLVLATPMAPSPAVLDRIRRALVEFRGAAGVAN